MSMQIEQSLFLPLLFACDRYGYPLLMIPKQISGSCLSELVPAAHRITQPTCGGFGGLVENSNTRVVSLVLVTGVAKLTVVVVSGFCAVR